MTAPPLCAAPNLDPKRPKNAIAAGACDCHFHIFDGPSPQVAARSYTAPPATADAYHHLQSTLGLDRGVIVQPSIYGTDNRTTLQSMPNDGSMRAVVVVDDDVEAKMLDELAAQGAVGARVNLLFSSGAKSADLKGFADKLAWIDWHLQVLTDISANPELLSELTQLPIPVVIDHMGHLPAANGIDDAGFQHLLRGLQTGNLWVKMSGAYRISDPAVEHYSDVAPLAQALIANNPERLVWGTDWPHPALSTDMPEDAELLDLLFEWTDAQTAQQILVRNPERLYGFQPWGSDHAE